MKIFRSKWILLWVSRLLWNGIEVVIDGVQFDTVDFCHRRWRNVFTIGSIKITVKSGFIKVTVFSVVQHRFSVINGTSNASNVAVVINLKVAFAILRDEFNAFLVHIIMAVIALHALLEESPKELLTVLTNCRSRVRVNLKSVRNFHSRNCPVAISIWCETTGAGVWNLLDNVRN